MISDPLYDIRKAYFSRLNNQVFYGGQKVHIYEMPPINAEGVYVLLAKQTANEHSTKDDDIRDTTMSILIIEALSEGNRTYANIDKVAQILLDKLQTLEVSGYNVISHIMEYSDHSMDKTTTGVEVVKLLRFRNKIEKL